MLSPGTTMAFIGANSGDITGLDYPVFRELEADVVGFLESTALMRWLNGPRAVVEFASGPINGSQFLFVRGFVRSVQSIEVRSGMSSDWTEHLVDDDDFADLFEFEVGGDSILRRGSTWPEGDRTVRVSYLAGFTQEYLAGETVPEDGDEPEFVAPVDIPSDAPRDLQRLVKLLCAVWHRTRPMQRPGGDGPIDLDDIPMSARMTIERYAASRLP